MLRSSQGGYAFEPICYEHGLNDVTGSVTLSVDVQFITDSETLPPAITRLANYNDWQIDEVGFGRVYDSEHRELSLYLLNIEQKSNWSMHTGYFNENIRRNTIYTFRFVFREQQEHAIVKKHVVPIRRVEPIEVTHLRRFANLLPDEDV